MSSLSLPVLIGLIVIALAFDFLNGVHDTANSIATRVSTRMLRPRYAVMWAAFFNFIAFLVFGVHVARTIGVGIIAADVMDALCGGLSSLFELAWLAVADERLEGFVEVKGDAPTPQWVAAFAEGARSGADPANDTLRSGVFVEAFPGAAFVVCGGRSAAIRRRERHEISVLVTVASRLMEVLGGSPGAVV